MVGLTVVIRAVAPFRIRRRNVGIGSFGSSRAKAGKPSRLIMTTIRPLAGTCAQAGPHSRAAHTASVIVSLMGKENSNSLLALESPLPQNIPEGFWEVARPAGVCD